MELLCFGSVPGAILPKEYDTIPVIEKHLSGATAVTRILGRILQPESNSNIANPLTRGRKTPWFSASLIVNSGLQIPNPIRKGSKTSICKSLFTLQRQRRFTHDLNW